MICVKELSKRYNLGGGQGVDALKGVSLELPDKGLVAVCGKSGSGKTTLFSCLAGLERFEQGSIEVFGKVVKGNSGNGSYEYLASTVGVMFQDFCLIDDLTVGQNIAASLRLAGQDYSQQAIEYALLQVDLSEYADRKSNQLSGGQQQRVAIARVVARQSKVLLADEPTGNLDDENGKIIWELLKKISKQKLVLVITHDSDSAKIFADRIITLKSGIIDSDQSNECNDSVQDECSIAAQSSNAETVRSHSRGLSIGFCAKYGLRKALQKKVRLAFSILLPVFSLVFFGISFSTLHYDDTVARLRYVYDSGQDIVRIRGWYDEDAEDYKTTNLGDLKDKALHSGGNAFGMLSYELKMTALESSNQYTDGEGRRSRYSEINSTLVVAQQTQLQDLGWDVLYGRGLPTQSGELVISKAVYQNILEKGYWNYETEQRVFVDDWDALQEASPKFVSREWDRWGDPQFGIVGVVDTKIEYEEFFDRYGFSKKYSDGDYLSGKMARHYDRDPLAFLQIMHIDDALTVSGHWDSGAYSEYQDNKLAQVALRLTGNQKTDKSLLDDIGFVVDTNKDLLYDEVKIFRGGAANILLYVSLIFVAFSSLIICNFVLASIKSNQKTIGVLKSMGAKRRTIFAIFASESTLIAIVTGIVAFLGTLVFRHILAIRTLPIDLMNIDVLLFFVMLVVVLGVSIIVTALPVFVKSNKSIIDIIRK